MVGFASLYNETGELTEISHFVGTFFVSCDFMAVREFERVDRIQPDLTDEHGF